MNIGFLMLSEHGGAGGLEQVARTMYYALAERGHHCKFYFMQPTNIPEYSYSFPFHYISSRIPDVFQRTTLLRPRLLHRWLARRAISDCLAQASSDKMDALLFLDVSSLLRPSRNILQKFRQQHPNIKLIAYPHVNLKNFCTPPRKHFALATI